MPINAMGQTRRAGDSKRLEAITALVTEARNPNQRLTIRRQAELVDRAVTGATGLRAESSKRTFRSECELALNVVEHFDTILALADRIWSNRKEGFHSKYHAVMKVCALLAPRRLHTMPYSVVAVEKHYNEHGYLPP